MNNNNVYYILDIYYIFSLKKFFKRLLSVNFS